MSTSNDPNDSTSSDIKMESQTVEQQTSLDQKPNIRTESVADVDLEAATSLPRRTDPRGQKNKLKTGLSVVEFVKLLLGFDKIFDSSVPSEKILEPFSELAAGSDIEQERAKSSWLRTKEWESVLFFERLHMVNIHQHESRLLDFSRGLREPVGDELHQTLHSYRQALDDLERIQGFSPSNIDRHLAKVLQERGIGIKSVGQERVEKKQRALRSSIDQFLYSSVQFFFAAFGGLLLVVPLLIMVYVPGKTASVVTTCLAVSGFAAQLAIWSSVAHYVEVSESKMFQFLRSSGLKFGSFEPKDIIGVTMAYAAVLVVFVGTSISRA